MKQAFNCIKQNVTVIFWKDKTKMLTSFFSPLISQNDPSWHYKVPFVVMRHIGLSSRWRSTSLKRINDITKIVKLLNCFRQYLCGEKQTSLLQYFEFEVISAIMNAVTITVIHCTLNIVCVSINNEFHVPCILPLILTINSPWNAHQIQGADLLRCIQVCSILPSLINISQLKLALTPAVIWYSGYEFACIV